MSLLTNPEISPGRALGMLRLLLVLPEDGRSLADISSLYWPHETRGNSPVDYPAKVLLELRRLGLVVEERRGSDRWIKVASKLRARLPASTPERAVEQLLPQLIIEALGSGELDPESADVDGTEEGSNDALAYLLAWWISLSVLDAPGDVAGLQDAIASNSFLGELARELSSPNDVRVRQFLQWASYLGVGWTSRIADRERLVLDPTALIRRFGARAWPKSEVLSMADARNRLAVLVPVLDGGRYLEAMSAYIPTVDERHLSEALSLALVRLESEGTLRLHTKTDATSWVLQWPREGLTTISHLEWMC